MGDEARCTASFGGEVSEGKALLETDELLFRGDFRVRIPFREVRAVSTEDGRLSVTFGDGTAVFELGPRAERWAEKIRNPKSLLDKIGVKPGARVALVGVDDQGFRELLGERTAHLRDGEPDAETDLVFVRAETVEELERLQGLERSLARNGAVWVVSPKGRRDIREADVLAAGKEAGLVDTKVVRFSDTHTAHKFVIPVARR